MELKRGGYTEIVCPECNKIRQVARKEIPEDIGPGELYRVSKCCFCGHELAKSNDTCFFCKGKLTRDPEGKYNFCSSCGILEYGGRRCLDCGHVQSEQISTCENCGKELFASKDKGLYYRKYPRGL